MGLFPHEFPHKFPSATVNVFVMVFGQHSIEEEEVMGYTDTHTHTYTMLAAKCAEQNSTDY